MNVAFRDVDADQAEIGRVGTAFGDMQMRPIGACTGNL